MADFQLDYTNEQINSTIGKTTNLEQNTGQAIDKIMSQKAVTDSVPTKTSDLTNDSDFITSDDIPDVPTVTQTTGQSTTSVMSQKAVTDDLSTKVDKITGKGLSTNDYTNDAKAKNDIITTDGNGDNYLSDDGTYKAVSSVTIEQSTGQSTTSVMSQKAVTDVVGNISVPTKTSDLTNDSDFITQNDIVVDNVTIEKTSGTGNLKLKNITQSNTTSAQTLNFGNTFTVPTQNINSYGQSTGKNTVTYTMPSIPESDGIKGVKINSVELTPDSNNKVDITLVDRGSSSGSDSFQHIDEWTLPDKNLKKLSSVQFYSAGMGTTAEGEFSYQLLDKFLEEIGKITVNISGGITTVKLVIPSYNIDYLLYDTINGFSGIQSTSNPNVISKELNINWVNSGSYAYITFSTSNKDILTGNITGTPSWDISISNYPYFRIYNSYTFPSDGAISGKQYSDLISGIKINDNNIIPDSSGKVNIVSVTSDVHSDGASSLNNFNRGLPNYCTVKKIVFPESISITVSSQQTYYFVANGSSASIRIIPASNSISLSHPSGSAIIYDESGFAQDFSVSYGFSWVSSSRTLYIYPNPKYPWIKSYTSSQDVEVLETDAIITYTNVADGNSGIITSSQYYDLMQKPISCEEVSTSGTTFTNRYFENQYPIYAFTWSSSGGKGPYTDQTSTVGNTAESYRIKALLRCSGYWKTGAGITRPIPYYGANGDYFYCDVNESTHRIESHQKLSLTSTEDVSYRMSVEFILI